MEWARENTIHRFVVTIMVVFVVLQVIQRDWAWAAFGVALLALNLVLWHRAPAATTSPDDPAVSTEVSTSLVPEQSVDATLAELFDRPGVEQAWSTGPAFWRQVSQLDEANDLAMPAAEVADNVWITTDDAPDAYKRAHWFVAVNDELKPLLDLDVEAHADPLVATLLSDPAVAEVMHIDREQYAVVLRAPLALDAVAALAARGLIAHHLDAVRRLVP